MRTVNLIFSRMGRSVIPLGMEGEHGVTTVRFDLSEELEHRPNASVTIKATSAAGVTYSRKPGWRAPRWSGQCMSRTPPPGAGARRRSSFEPKVKRKNLQL